METRLLIQSANGNQNDSLHAALAASVQGRKFDYARIAVAYATVAGVRSLLDAFEHSRLVRSQWLVGLDDSLTQPGAIELLLSLPHSKVQIASFETSGCRFHPKFYVFARTGKPQALSAIVGSPNLTVSAFQHNSEAAALLDCNSKKDRDAVNAAWDILWAHGHEPSAEDMRAYSKIYAKRSRLIDKLHKVANANPDAEITPSVLDSDAAEVDPSMAKICWIECGNVTAMGRELEFKAEQGLFFGLDPGGGVPKTITFATSDHSHVNLRMKYQENHMWRLQLKSAVPEVRVGLRPVGKDGKLSRSPYVAVFKRTMKKEIIQLRFLNKDSEQFDKIRTRTMRSGTMGRTTAREYGWCT